MEDVWTAQWSIDGKKAFPDSDEQHAVEQENEQMAELKYSDRMEGDWTDSIILFVIRFRINLDGIRLHNHKKDRHVLVSCDI